ncbi:MAG TPA: porin family protein [Longimicrobiales bacterium]|nr:porin family protein [Longimicrobiales bacterium]
MKFCRRSLLLAILAPVAFTPPLSAQEIALKGGIAVSHFQSVGPNPFDGTFVSTAFGGHARFRFGRVALQPELQMVSRGATAEASALDERMRLEYMEVPLMLVVPVRVGSFEPYAFGGPMISLETRCRSIIEENNLKTNFDCDDRSGGNAFDRRALDYGASAGAGVSHKLGSGRVLLEGRYTWGLRDIYDGPDDIEVRNRSYVVSIGYTIMADGMN